MNVLFRGFWASTMATSSMTLAMFQSFKNLPLGARKPLPPAQLLETFSQKTGLLRHMGPEMQSEATMISHYGYGAMCGVAYALLAERTSGNGIVKGGLFGLGVWAASYYGLIPSLDLKPQAQAMRPERNAMMALTHVVWGASLGYAEQSLREKGLSMLDGKRARHLTHLH